MIKMQCPLTSFLSPQGKERAKQFRKRPYIDTYIAISQDTNDFLALSFKLNQGAVNGAGERIDFEGSVPELQQSIPSASVKPLQHRTA